MPRSSGRPPLPESKRKDSGRRIRFDKESKAAMRVLLRNKVAPNVSALIRTLLINESKKFTGKKQHESSKPAINT